MEGLTREQKKDVGMITLVLVVGGIFGGLAAMEVIGNDPASAFFATFACVIVSALGVLYAVLVALDALGDDLLDNLKKK